MLSVRALAGTARVGLPALLVASLLLNGYLLWVDDGARAPRDQPHYAPNMRPNPTAPLATAHGDSLSSEDLQLLFDADDFRDALLGYQLLLRKNFQPAQRLKRAWLESAQAWLEAGDRSPRLNQFLQAALDLQPNDVDFRLLLAQSYVASGDGDKLLQAIDIYYRLLSESSQAMQGLVVAEIQQVVKQRVILLSEQQAWQPLIRFAERLLWHEPLHPPYIFIYARALVKVERYASAQNSLRTIIYDEYYGAKAQQMLDEIALLDFADQAIALQSQGAHYHVGGSINGRYPVNLMIDTGASLSVISPAALHKLGVSPAPTFVRNARINTAGGKVDAAVYRVENFAIGDYSVPNMEFVLLDINNDADSDGAGDGLLGMNFLRNFVFKIDQKNNLLLLSTN